MNRPYSSVGDTIFPKKPKEQIARWFEVDFSCMYCEKRKIADGQSQKLCEKPLDGDVCQWTTAIGCASSSDRTIQSSVKIMQINNCIAYYGRWVPGISRGFHLWHSQPLDRIVPHAWKIHATQP